MNNHTYLRAYLGGVFIPTLVFPVLVTALAVGKYLCGMQFPVERIVIFPLAFMPVLWGLWNVFWVALRRIAQPSLGLHGAILPFLIMPIGATLARHLDVISFGSSSVTWFRRYTDSIRPDCLRIRLCGGAVLPGVEVRDRFCESRAGPRVMESPGPRSVTPRPELQSATSSWCGARTICISMPPSSQFSSHRSQSSHHHVAAAVIKVRVHRLMALRAFDLAVQIAAVIG